jgi:tetratricopeptide (TPR) repeat protein
LAKLEGADISQELHSLDGSGPYSDFLLGNLATLQARDLDAIRYFEKFVQNDNLPPALSKQLDRVYLNTARAYYNLRKFEQAVKYYKLVSTGSNLQVYALVELSLVYIILKKYKDSVGAAYSVHMGPLRKAFAVDASLTAGMAYFEACQYGQVYQAIQYFRKTFDASYKWLYEWYTRSVAGGGSTSLYSKALEGTQKNSKSTIPQPIISEWFRSPIITAYQDEINLYFDEQKLAQSIITQLVLDALEVSKQKRPSKMSLLRNARATTLINGFLKQFIGQVHPLQKQLVTEINKEIVALNRSMIERWRKAYTNSQLLEVEVFDATGSSIVKKGYKSNTSHRKNNSETADEHLPVLDWGEISVDNTDDEEKWADEGLLKTDFDNLCTTTKSKLFKNK